MSKLTRTLLVGATLAAISLAGMTTVAHAYPLDPANQRHRALGQLEFLTPADHAVASQQRSTGDATARRLLARERFSVPNQTAAQVPAPTPAQPNRPRGWLLAALGVLAAALLLAIGLAVLAARRTRRRAPPRVASLPR